MLFVAELNNENICISIKQVSANYINEKNDVVIEAIDLDLINRKYEEGNWSEEKFLTIELSKLQPTIEEQILAENQYQTALLEMQMLGGI